MAKEFSNLAKPSKPQIRDAPRTLGARAGVRTRLQARRNQTTAVSDTEANQAAAAGGAASHTDAGWGGRRRPRWKPATGGLEEQRVYGAERQNGQSGILRPAKHLPKVKTKQGLRRRGEAARTHRAQTSSSRTRGRGPGEAGASATTSAESAVYSGRRCAAACRTHASKRLSTPAHAPEGSTEAERRVSCRTPFQTRHGAGAHTDTRDLRQWRSLGPAPTRGRWLPPRRKAGSAAEGGFPSKWRCSSWTATGEGPERRRRCDPRCGTRQRRRPRARRAGGSARGVGADGWSRDGTRRHGPHGERPRTAPIRTPRHAPRNTARV